MLQPFAKQEDIPEVLREHYSKREDGQWHADIPDTHPAVKHNAKLLSEKATAEGKVAQLTSDLESARAGNLGRGQVAIAKSDAQLLDQYKALGTPDEVGAIKTEHATLKEKDTKRSREDSLRQVSKALSYNEEAFTRLPSLPDFISRPGKDGKTVEWFAQVKDDKGVITEKPAKEFVEASADIAPFMAALKATSQQSTVQLPGSSMTVTPPSSDPDAWAKQFAEEYNKGNTPTTDLFTAFNNARSA